MGSVIRVSETQEQDGALSQRCSRLILIFNISNGFSLMRAFNSNNLWTVGEILT